MGCLRPGAPRRREVVELHMQQAERHRDVAQAAVDTDHALCCAHAVDQCVQVHRRPDLGVRAQGLLQALRARLLHRAGLRQRDAPALRDDSPPELGPRGFGPELVAARAAVHEHHRRCTRTPRRCGAQAELRWSLDTVAERARRQLARAVERVDVGFDADRVVHQPACGCLEARTVGAVRQTVAHPLAGAVRYPRDERRLGQALQVEHRVVALRAQPLAKRPPLGAHGVLPPGLAPAPQRAFDDLVDAVHTPQQRREARLDDPVDQRVWMGGKNVVQHRHRMHHVAQRRELDDQDAQARSARVSPRPCVPVQCTAAAIFAFGLTTRSAAMKWVWIRSSACGVWPSKRITSTGVVFDERIRPKPSL